METMTKTNLEQSPLKVMLKSYSSYNYWANKTLIDWLRDKPAHELRKAVPSSFAGIELTLNHILQTQEFWLQIIKDEHPIKENFEELSLSALLDRVVMDSLKLSKYVSKLNEDELGRKLHLKSPWFDAFQPRFELIMHVVNHSTYHRGQITSIGRSLGYTDAPMTDYNYFLLNAN